mmetsp:Transcript_57399/g.171213  ORF Transcript_57399/g.171213 Transcript_57399/m.171213 type:complete len:232 (-) Transcript_57399:175-870(-)
MSSSSRKISRNCITKNGFPSVLRCTTSARERVDSSLLSRRLERNSLTCATLRLLRCIRVIPCSFSTSSSVFVRGWSSFTSSSRYDPIKSSPVESVSDAKVLMSSRDDASIHCRSSRKSTHGGRLCPPHTARRNDRTTKLNLLPAMAQSFPPSVSAAAAAAPSCLSGPHSLRSSPHASPVIIRRFGITLVSRATPSLPTDSRIVSASFIRSSPEQSLAMRSTNSPRAAAMAE